MMILDLPPPAYVALHRSPEDTAERQSLGGFLAWVDPFGQTGQLAVLASVENRIEELCRLEPNWDGYGALPISQGTKYNSLATLRGILQSAPSPELTPNPNGTLSFEWETREGSAHLEVGQTKVSFYLKPIVGKPLFVESIAPDIFLASVAIGNLVSTYLYPGQNVPASVTLISMFSNVQSAH
jgi:hypothetical protein